MEKLNVPSGAEFVLITRPLPRKISIGTPGSGQIAEPVFAKIVVPYTLVSEISVMEMVADPMKWLRALMPRGANEWVTRVPSAKVWT